MRSLIENCMKLGFGMMRLPKISQDGKEVIDVEQTKDMVDAFLAAGGKYIDTAFVYTGSEEATRKALVERHPRDSYYLATKLNAGSWAAKNEQEAKDQFRISLERTGAGYFDFYLLHALGKGNVEFYDKYGIWDYVKGLKEEGLIRHWGFSFHDSPEFLDKLLTDHPDAEFVQLQINYADWENADVQSRACYEVAAKHDKPIVVMEPVKGGTLASPPEVVRDVFSAEDPSASYASWAIRFAASLPQVMVVLSGMSSREQMADNLSYMALDRYRPLSDREKETVEKAREALNSIEQIPCTSCRYCTGGCPMKINIPEIFRVMNEYKLFGDLEKAKRRYAMFGQGEGSLADACIKCGQCEGACPQHLPIITYLEEIASALG
ncbi:MAG: aldo/keto reductase [Lachnospiraceae bacterium]|nr:aldo/keto reductase [Lachnospiraceae bacterium]